MVKAITFATTNEGKLREAADILGIKVVGTPLEINEIQSLDAAKVAIQKAHDYFAELTCPLIIEDVAFSFDALKGLPGPYISDFSKALGNDGLIDLLGSKENRRATATTTLVYVDENGTDHIFSGEMEGTIAIESKGTNGFGWDPIFIPKGETRTLAEMELGDKNRYSMRAKTFSKLKSWLQSQEG